jgi:hypothetical protein
MGKGVVFTIGRFLGSLAGYREAAAEQILHRSLSPRLDLGIQDGRSRGNGVTGMRQGR